MGNFSVDCKVCKGEVESFNQDIKFILVPDGAVQQHEQIRLSCGCVIDFPNWDIDINTGMCRVSDFADVLYFEFLDVEMIMGEDDL